MERERFICNDMNFTNSSELDLDYTLADTGKIVAGVLIFLLTLPFVLFEFRFLPLGTTPAVLAGAVLMVATTVISQDDAYTYLGDAGNLRTIILLIGMMLLAQYFEREQIIDSIIKVLLKDNISFVSYLWRVCLATSIAAAFITNDAACVVLTPMLLDNWKRQNRPRVELETLLLAIATSANIASAATIFGNPQMALIASKTSVPNHAQSRLDLLKCITYLGLPTLIGSVLNVCFLIIHWKIRSRVLGKSGDTNYEQTQFIENEAGAIGITGDTNCSNNMYVKSASPAGSHNKKCIDGHGMFSRNRQRLSSEISEGFDSNLLKVPNVQMHYSISNLETTDFGTSGSEPSTSQTSLRRTRRYSSSLSDLEHTDHIEKLFVQNEQIRVSSEKCALESKTTKQIESYHQAHIAGSEASLSLTSETGQSLDHKQNISKSDKIIIEPSGLQMTNKFGISRSVQSIAIPVTRVSERPYLETHFEQVVDSEFKASNSRFFHFFLWFCLLCLLVLLCVDTDTIHFDMGLLPMATATVVMFMDALCNRRSALPILRRIDWSVIVMFLGLFVWMAGINSTRIPRWIWKHMGLAGSQFNNLTSLTILCVFVVVCSNIFSNVPLTIIVLEQLQPCRDQLPLVLYLAWCSTIAGNLTLFGSVANLIVAQKSKSCLRYQFSYWAYLKYGFATTVVIVVVGIAILNGLLQVV